jgi:2-phosphosulfolactate phosphatase
VVLLCSGWVKSASLEDTLFSGALAERLLSGGSFQMVDDATSMAIRLWLQAKSDPYDYCKEATHVQRLQRMDYDRDIRFAFQSDTCLVVPQVVDELGRICLKL